MALEASPENNSLRIHIAQLLIEHGRLAEAAAHAVQAIQQEPGNASAIDVLTAASTALQKPVDAMPRINNAAAEETQTVTDEIPARQSFDWSQAEQQLGKTSVPPPFVDKPRNEYPQEPLLVTPNADSPAAIFEEYGERVTLADVGGLDLVKKRLHESFLEPMKHPELAKAFGKSLRGGLMLYGPPGCGKTFIARAVAGELGASFLTASLADLLGSHFGETEKNLQRLFAQARERTPAVLFLDEIDAIGAKRSTISSGWSGMRAIVDQLLMELDSMSANNDGLFVLAATNSPWDVDNALLRPGRLDRMLLVLPPDAAARDAILRIHFARRPIAGIDLYSIVMRTEGFSGADLEHIVSSSAEQAMLRSIQLGEVSPITMADIERILPEVRPSTQAWLSSARNVVQFGNEDGRYDELQEYLVERGIA